ncbi:hypothetical protein Lgee_0789 [Legionella geestiana]|uniref:Uncharacterized protein n=1 Tax=Legionella geestiana TaxID=45065 RepID=A0A0W0U3D5_9GAMM|nr:DUF308 domain-containing protein [Legionella geestiana]KTD01993.1 hypothetical protein Lgee_0789 [Legionella geestiana]QBS12036.1 DUF308 domain-containing protein [Legionella geestiana]QDQ40354.1 DUF308 domain-containing protein [Legionella geestiana]STX53245.1 Uncharacterised protein [Legionella geestiana]
MPENDDYMTIYIELSTEEYMDLLKKKPRDQKTDIVTILNTRYMIEDRNSPSRKKDFYPDDTFQIISVQVPKNKAVRTSTILEVYALSQKVSAEEIAYDSLPPVNDYVLVKLSQQQAVKTRTGGESLPSVSDSAFVKSPQQLAAKTGTGADTPSGTASFFSRNAMTVATTLAGIVGFGMLAVGILFLIANPAGLVAAGIIVGASVAGGIIGFFTGRSIDDIREKDMPKSHTSTTTMFGTLMPEGDSDKKPGHDATLSPRDSTEVSPSRSTTGASLPRSAPDASPFSSTSDDPPSSSLSKKSP